MEFACKVHNTLGSGFSEIVYKDAIEYELKKAGIIYTREKEYFVNYKDCILAHKFYADFVIYNSIILEVKSVNQIIDEFVSQALNYLHISKNRLALLVNFGGQRLTYKRIVV